MANPKIEIIKLPQPKYKSTVSLEEALWKRRSTREYKNEPLTLFEISQLLWAAQGITESRVGFRTTPSAGALYPLEIYLVVGNVNELSDGVYKYKPQGHELMRVSIGDKRKELCTVALHQSSIRSAPAVIVFSAVYARISQKYGERGIRYTLMEAGHAAQNVYLQAVALNLGIVAIGAFQDEAIKKLLEMPDNEEPLYIMPVGKL